MGFKLMSLDYLLGGISYQRSYNWEIILPSLSSVNADDVSSRAIDLSFGPYSLTAVVDLFFGAYHSKYLGQFSIPDISIKFTEKEDLAVTQYFQDWQSLQIPYPGLFNEKMKYALPVTIIFYSTDGSETLRIRIINAFPTKLPNFNLSYGSSDIMRFDVSLNVDRMYFSGNGRGRFSTPNVKKLTKGGLLGNLRSVI